MTSLACRDSGWRRSGGGRRRRRRGVAIGRRRPLLLREISRCDPDFLLSEGFCHPRHGLPRYDLDVTISTLVVVQLFHEVIFLLTPDDRNRRISGHAVHAVAVVANPQLGAEFSIRARVRDRHLDDLITMLWHRTLGKHGYGWHETCRDLESGTNQLSYPTQTHCGHEPPRLPKPALWAIRSRFGHSA